MKKIKLKSVVFVLFSMAIFASCSSDEDTKNPETPQPIFKSAYATEVTGPTTGKVNEELTYMVSFTVDNACGEYNKMTDIEIKKEKGYQVEAKYPATCSTPDSPQTKRTAYKVKPTMKGTFYLRIAKSETEYIVTTVVID